MKIKPGLGAFYVIRTVTGVALFSGQQKQGFAVLPYYT